mmetsp:Transcript_19406/g.47930  ORF Transcript_19406/g.47930 Transcript_19406/m.47930 type:complete len:295 (+) Transcript_19406:1516-2400(+)
MHTLLGYSVSDIVANYLVKLSMIELDSRIKYMRNEDIKGLSDIKRLNQKVKARFDLQFGDYYLTNQQEQGSIGGTIFQPFNFKLTKPRVEKGVREDLGGYMVSPTSVVTESSLIKKIEWRYTYYPKTTNPRIGEVKLTMLKKVDGKHVELAIGETEDWRLDGVKLDSDWHVLEGLFIVTNFQMSSDIRRLRLCGSEGSNSAEDFLDAFKYYALWNISPGARDIIRKMKDEEKRERRNRVKQETVEKIETAKTTQSESPSPRATVRSVQSEGISTSIKEEASVASITMTGEVKSS